MYDKTYYSPKGDVIFWEVALHHRPQLWRYNWRYVSYSLRDYCGHWGWGSLLISHHPVKFSNQRPCENDNITLSIGHTNTSDSIIERTWNFDNLWLLIIFQDTANFGCHMSHGNGNISICHMINWPHDYRVTWRWWWWSFILTHQSANYGSLF